MEASSALVTASAGLSLPFSVKRAITMLRTFQRLFLKQKSLILIMI